MGFGQFPILVARPRIPGVLGTETPPAVARRGAFQRPTCDEERTHDLRMPTAAVSRQRLAGARVESICQLTDDVRGLFVVHGLLQSVSCAHAEARGT